jgi:hypothetical protein
MHAHLAGDVTQHDVAVFQLYPEGRVREILDDLPLHFDYVFFRHLSFLSFSALMWGINKGLAPLFPYLLGNPAPLKLAFFNRLSYWCDMMYACTCDMKSMVTTTMISNEVPPK